MASSGGLRRPRKARSRKSKKDKLPRDQLKLPMIDDMDTEAVDQFVWTQILARLRPAAR